MNESMKMYWQLVFETLSNETLIKQTNNPIREYENELIEGAIVDVGCGQSPFLLEFSSTDRELIAIDNEQTQLDLLKKRVECESSSKLENWRFLNQFFPQDGLPDKKYSLMIFSNLLHFFSLEDCIKIGSLIAQKSSQGTLVFVSVHSENFYDNNPSDPNNNDYFKHYFTIADLQKVFPKDLFERTYYAEVEKLDSQIERGLINKCLDQSLKVAGINDPKIIEHEKKSILENMRQSDIITIFKRK